MLLRDAAEAEDILQEVFVRIMRYGGPDQEEPIPLAFLYRTAERCCFDRLRKRNREAPAASECPAEVPVAAGQEGHQEVVQLLQRFLHRLPPKVIQVALLHYVDGLPQERIAAELGWSRRTVGKKLKLLRQKAARLRRSTAPGQENIPNG
jgi:RNA polymerase sigma-70 factor (ECF subfamily)